MWLCLDYSSVVIFVVESTVSATQTQWMINMILWGTLENLSRNMTHQMSHQNRDQDWLECVRHFFVQLRFIGTLWSNYNAHIFQKSRKISGDILIIGRLQQKEAASIQRCPFGFWTPWDFNDPDVTNRYFYFLFLFLFFLLLLVCFLLQLSF